MIPPTPTVDSFLNAIVSGLYTRAQASSPPRVNHGMVIVDDPATVDDILKSPDQFRKSYSLVSVLGSSRFSANAGEWQCRRDLTQPNYVRAAHSRSRSSIYAVYDAELTNIENATTSSTAIQRALLEAAVTVFFHALDC